MQKLNSMQMNKIVGGDEDHSVLYPPKRPGKKPNAFRSGVFGVGAAPANSNCAHSCKCTCQNMLR